MQVSHKSPVSVFWFKRDLRAANNVALSKCIEAGLPVLPLYVIEPELWQQPDASCRQYVFITECLSELRENLGAMGQPLIVRVGAVTDILDDLGEHHTIRYLFSHEETGNAWTFQRDKAVKHWCGDKGVDWTEYWQNGVVRGLKDRNGWAGTWGRRMHMPLAKGRPHLPPVQGVEPGKIPKPRQLGLADDNCSLRQPGGRTVGLETLESFLARRGENYRTDMSSPLKAVEGCSRLSPYLAHGALSLQEVAQATTKRQIEVRSSERPTGAWRGSLSSFSGRLHWHCHFMQKLENEPDLEFYDLHPAYQGMRTIEPESQRLVAWEQGETGLPFVDACMRFLRANGWINFRMRAMLVAVASYHLWLDWRVTGHHLARLFTDYEPGIHWPQMQMQSGTTGINAVRIYNPVKQGLDQDPQGVFVRQWVPELASVPTEHIHHPWTWENAASVLDNHYPMPVVDHLAAAKEARQKIWAVRKGDAYFDEAKAIQVRHGSRRSSFKTTTRRSKPGQKKKPDSQLSLDL